jgi:hypothetical protein
MPNGLLLLLVTAGACLLVAWIAATTTSTGRRVADLVGEEPVGAIGLLVGAAGLAVTGLIATRQASADLEIGAVVPGGQRGDTLLVQTAFTNDGLAGASIKRVTFVYRPLGASEDKEVELDAFGAVTGLGVPGVIDDRDDRHAVTLPVGVVGRSAVSLGLLFAMPHCAPSAPPQPDPVAALDCVTRDSARLKIRISPGQDQTVPVEMGAPRRRASPWTALCQMDDKGRLESLSLTRRDALSPSRVDLVELLIWHRNRVSPEKAITRPVAGSRVEFPVPPASRVSHWVFRTDDEVIAGGRVNRGTCDEA